MAISQPVTAQRSDPAAPFDERLLVRRAKGGDVTAFEALYRATVGRIYALCLRLTADASRAEELTQAAFVRGWERLGTFRGDAAFSSWLHRLAVNLTFEEQRTLRRRQLREDAAAPSGEPRTASRGGTAIDLDRAIAALPPQARQVFALHDVEGYRHDEIAALLGIAVGTSKAHLHRARKQLKEILR